MLNRPGWYVERLPFGPIARLHHVSFVAGVETDCYAPGGDTLEVGWQSVLTGMQQVQRARWERFDKRGSWRSWRRATSSVPVSPMFK